MYRVASGRAIVVSSMLFASLFVLVVGSTRLALDHGVSGGSINGWTFVDATNVGAQALWTVLSFSPAATLIAVGVGVFVAVLNAVASAATVAGRDPQRMFTATQRKLAADLAGGRCEMERLWWFRCHRDGGHADHFFPHSRGGASTMTNLVWACPSCNLAKSATVPTVWQKMRLERRRSRYFPPTHPVTVGEKYRQ